MRAPLLVACALGLVTGCERLLSIQDPVAAEAPGDAATVFTSPLLLSEVVLAPADGEMIEIVNPSNQDVDLSNYYLSDSGNYFRLPVQATVDTTDFIVRFPDGARIPPHGVVTIAIGTPVAFAGVYQMAPSFSLIDGSMRTVVTNGVVHLTDQGEPIILFQWDGRSDLVHDVDLLLAGVPSTANPLPSKSGMSQDGPDPDAQATAYAIDASSIRPQASAPGSGASTKRIALEDGHETQAGTGNGPSGDDETSEDTSATWDTTFTAPTPGDVPKPLLR